MEKLRLFPHSPMAVLSSRRLVSRCFSSFLPGRKPCCSSGCFDSKISSARPRIRNARKIVRKNVRRNGRKNVTGYVRYNVRIISNKDMSEKLSDRKSEECQKVCQKIFISNFSAKSLSLKLHLEINDLNIWVC